MSQFSDLTRKLLKLSLIVSPLAPLPLLLTPETSYAQVTTATVRGTILDASGNPVNNADVKITHTGSNISKSTQTNESGTFAFSGLRVGGPYTIEATSPAGAYKTEGVSLKAGNNDTITLGEKDKVSANASDNNIEKFEVTGTRARPSMGGKLYDSEDIRKTPSLSRDPKEIVQLTPDAYIDGDSLSIGGNSNKYNSITVDGIRQDDDFGLNENGYPTNRSPVSMEAIEEISVNKTPFDVRFSKFLGGNINIVTKSGTNEFTGSAIVVHSSGKLTGTKTKDQEYKQNFTETSYGLTLGGPIIADKLHFFLSLEGLKATEPDQAGVQGSGAIYEASNITAAEVADVQRISKNVYGFDAGEVGQEGEETDLKLLAKFNYVINPLHNLEFTYQTARGNEIRQKNPAASYLPLTSNWYNKRETLNSYSLKLLSDWTFDFSTKLEINKKYVKTEQNPLNGRDFMQATIDTNSDPEINEDIVLGPDIYRHANALENETTRINLETNYLMQNHLITSGVEYDATDVFNLFLPSSNGDADYASIEDFENKKPSGLFYQNTISNDANDAAAEWGYGVVSLYAQDEYQITSNLVARGGLRYESYSAKGNINENAKFIERHGFDNTATINGKTAILPRLGLAYKATNRLNINGGFGLYSGGSPNVWVSNTYTNDGINVANTFSKNADGFDGRNIPDDIQNRLKSGDGNVDALDPDFKIPQSWKFAFGADYRFDIPTLGNNYIFAFDYTYTKVKHGVNWIDLRRNHSGFDNNTPTAKAPDGRDIYGSDFNTKRGYDLLLTNTDKGFSHVANFGVRKNFNSGFNFSTSYSWQKVQDVISATSATSYSNYAKEAVGLDPNDRELATSNYEREHRFLITTGYDYNIFDNLLTSFSMFIERRSGQPLSYTFGGSRDSLGALFGESNSFSGSRRNLFYVPKGDGSDVSYGDDFNKAAFEDYLSETGLDKYRGKIAPRNAFRGDWVNQINFRMAQELPGYKESHKAKITFDVENLPNLLNKKWGQVNQPGFPYMIPVANVNFDNDSGKYVYTKFVGEDDNQLRLSESVWKLQLTASYQF